jgi:hypothetical protein
MYAKNIKNKDIGTLNIMDSWGIYSLWVLSFYEEDRVKSHFTPIN